MNNYVALGDLIKSISKTHKFDKDELVFLNTSDVLEGKILIDYYTPVSKLKGQAKKTIKNGDILYSEIRPKNKRYAYVKNVKNTEDYVVSTKLMVLRNSSEKLNTDYLYHFLTFEGTINYLQKRAENRIGSFPQITFDIVKTIKIWLPELQTQEQIAKVLSDLDAKIEVNNKINQELEAFAKTIYDYWFVQFDFPDENGKPYKSSGGKMVYNEELKREIPEGWEDGNILKCAELISGGTPSKKNETFWNGDIPFYTPADYVNSVYTVKTESYTNSLGIKSSAAKLMRTGTTIITARGTVGNVNIIGIPMAMNQSCYAFYSKKDYSNEFVYYQILQMVRYLKAKSSGSVFKSIVTSDVQLTPTIIPNKKTVKEFTQIVKPFFNKILNNINQNQKLAELRDWLLPMLMNGQAKVKAVEEEIDGEVVGKSNTV